MFVISLRDFQGLVLAKSHANKSEFDNAEYMNPLLIEAPDTAPNDFKRVLDKAHSRKKYISTCLKEVYIAVQDSEDEFSTENELEH